MVQWDGDKAAANLRKHRIDFADAVTVLSDEFAITVPEHHEDADRYVTVGADALGRILVVAYSWRGDEVRLISARNATRSERRQYESKR